MKPPRRRALRHEDAVLALVLLAIAIPAAIALPMVWLGELDLKSRLTLTLAVAAGSGGLALAVRSRVMRPLQTLANLTASLRERDYAVRGRHVRGDDSLGLAIAELAQLAAPDRRGARRLAGGPQPPDRPRRRGGDQPASDRARALGVIRSRPRRGMSHRVAPWRVHRP
ncbi:MAG TPA: hypothetical protein VF516_26145 [Kofleriaceae bacterium]